MNSFVDIKTAYRDRVDRNIQFLSSVYHNRSDLLQMIKSLIDSNINEEEINNKKVLLKPNWVKHNQQIQDEVCLRTNENFIMCVIEVILSKKPKSIIIGDAPIQGCDWRKMLSDSFYQFVDYHSKKNAVPIIIKDFRRVTFDPQSNKLEEERKSIEEYVIFDLKDKSYLEPISDFNNKFRVTQYDPSKLAESHTVGTHKYCITKELFDADIVFSLPKIKTHQKTGITNALKNLVGLNGDKDYLPHHRIGGLNDGGDCYPGKNILRKNSELLLDKANKNKGNIKYKLYSRFASLLWKISFPSPEHQIAAGWYGNDTTWRMVMDLNRIALFGKEDGTLSDVKQRQIYSLCDGIIGGQGNGPLEPVPLELGIIMLSNNNFLADIVAGELMKMKIEKIYLLSAANKTLENDNYRIEINNEIISFKDLSNYSIDTLMPPGWVNYNK